MTKQPQLGPLKLSHASTKFGADMGRPSCLPVDRQVEVKLRLVLLERIQGYDEGGAYWGYRSNGDRLYWAESTTKHEVDTFCVCDRPLVRLIQMSCWAKNRDQAKEKIRKEMPNAKFYR